jgi:histidinol dehydrogenase
MIRTVDLRGRSLSKAQYNNELPRATLNVQDAMVIIQPILERVKNGTEADLIALAQEFDGVKPASIKVAQSALDLALAQLDPAIRTALEISIQRITKVHNDQLRAEKTTTVVDGGTVTEKWIPVDRVGLYVPGGRAVYPSSVMMNVIPAQIA